MASLPTEIKIELDLRILQPNIGIGITTHNRYNVFRKTYEEIKRFSPDCKIVVVDDASTTPVPEATYRFEKNAGIAKAKNKCFELLDDCEHIFLFDDDCYPIVTEWWLPYVESDQPHLMYIFQDFATGKKLNDNILLYQDAKLKAWSHPRGVMCYFKRVCLERVGGMDVAFGRWGWEHPQLSDRIFNVGLTKYRYADVVGSEKLFYSADEYQAVNSTVSGAARNLQIQRNKPVYEQKRNDSHFIPYREKKNIILTSYFTEILDPQRGTKWEFCSSDVVELLFTTAGQCPVVILYDAKPGTYNKAGDCIGEKDNNDCPEYVSWHWVPTSINPYFQRWFSYYEYLVENRRSINKVFCVDATDVQMLKAPFLHMEIGKLYTGDEVGQISCEWMVKHHRAPVLASFFKLHRSSQILNAGLLGGDIDTVIAFCKAMMDFYCETESNAFHNKVPDAGMTDMGAFNYVAYTKFAGCLQHGPQVNTEFKKYEKNEIAWFKHK